MDVRIAGIKYICWILLGIGLWSCGVKKPEEILLAETEIPEFIDFNYDVKPILSDKCYACHGPDEKKQKGGLRLDTPEGAYAALKDNPNKHAIVPNDLSASMVYTRMISTDPELQMPPPNSNLTLSAKEIAIISRWIEQGAVYKPHWSFIKPALPQIPTLKDQAWVRSPIDAFVAARLQQQGLQPSPPATAEDLIRRASFDLLGLPPSLEEIEAFTSSPTDQAYEALLDRLLASPAYGERMASEWMDVARYADSDGYLDDKHRDFSPWRNWVIDSYNRNMPYNRFITWQLAGDLVANKTQESILATAFNRLHKKNSEAGIVFEEYRVEYNADRVQTVSQAVLGLSVQCARCHDHKYDPISQEAYYKMFGLFNSTNEIGSPVYGPDQTPGPALLLTDQESETLLTTIRTKIKKEENGIKTHKTQATSAFNTWLASTTVDAKVLNAGMEKSLVAYYPFDKINNSNPSQISTPNLAQPQQPALCKEPILQSGKKGNAYFVSDYNSIKLGHGIGWKERTDAFTVDLWIYPKRVYPDAGIFYHCEDIRLGYKGYSLRLADNKLQFIVAHSYPQNAIQVSTQKAVPANRWTRVTVTYDGSSKAEGAKIYLNGETTPLSQDFDNLYKGILYEKNIHTYTFEGFTLGQRNLLIPFKDGGIDELKIYDRDLTPIEVLYSEKPAKVWEALANDDTKNKLLRPYYFARADQGYKRQKKSLKVLMDQENQVLNAIPEIMVMGDLPSPRPTYVLGRGVYNIHEQEVKPSAIETVLPFAGKFPPNRLGLAQWLFDKDHPLTARVYVNRIWQMHFGHGLVRSAADFGNQGDLPTHPDLLDWLALNFMESGWDVKKLHKTIMLSATYRQSSALNPKLLEKDPENLLLARGARFRLSAEMIRDNALSVSGLLVSRLGGPSVYPYQPEGIWDELSDKSWRYKYLQEPGDGLYRRSLYTIWKRTSPPPAMLIFDAPERGECVVKRRPTSTPLQALVLLNDPQYLEAARKLAERLWMAGGSNQQQLLGQAFRLLTGRSPKAKEMDILSQYYEDELKKFKEQPQKARAYLSTGYLPLAPGLPPAPVAALATVAHAIMNTDEAYTRK
ncbi:cytochrome c [Dyadobacter jejuensis]|uniref:Cytochrome c n=2 Tax=Dyadobacter jejuensis TaxID=1082580 RepID=A0A316AHJ3_9BACT|nr:cytochrome c [Dyadobacter jejuensis]